MALVIELWLENSFMIEVLTAEMQAQYLGAMTKRSWRHAPSRPPPAPA